MTIVDTKICFDCNKHVWSPYYSFKTRHTSKTFYRCEDCGDARQRASVKSYKDLIKRLRDDTKSSIKKATIAYGKCRYDYNKAKELLNNKPKETDNVKL